MEGNIYQEEKFNEAKKLTTVIYALYAASFLVGVTSIFAIIINYIKKDEMAGLFSRAISAGRCEPSVRPAVGCFGCDLGICHCRFRRFAGRCDLDYLPNRQRLAEPQ